MSESANHNLFYDTAEAVLRITPRWGIIPWLNSESSFHQDITRSASDEREKDRRRFWVELQKGFPNEVGIQLIQSILEGDARPLTACSRVITEAAKREDEDFFIALGEVLQKRRRGRLPTGKVILGPTSYPQLIARLWLEGSLWLMTDRTALKFINRVSGQIFELPAYRAAKRSWKLNKHPASPIIDVEWLIPESVNLLGLSRIPRRAVCKPILRKGWRVVGGVLTQREG